MTRTHLSWAGLLLPLIALGGDRWSLDHLLGIDARPGPGDGAASEVKR